MSDGLKSMHDDAKAPVRIPIWLVGILLTVIATVLSYTWGAGNKSNQLERLLSDTSAIQLNLSNISRDLTKIQSHEEAGDVKLEDISRRITNAESLIERNRQEIESLRSKSR